MILYVRASVESLIIFDCYDLSSSNVAVAGLAALVSLQTSPLFNLFPDARVVQFLARRVLRMSR